MLFSVRYLLFSAVLLPVQQHSVPQNITGFEFKLVGFLTLKQFGYLVATAVFSFLFYAGLGGILRWLVIIPIVLFGLVLAFIPINGMPFDKWVAALVRSIIFPSIRIWHKEPKEIGFLAPEFSYYLRRAPTADLAIKPGRVRLDSYLATVRSRRPVDKLETLEKTKLSALPLSATEKASLTGPRPVEVSPIKERESITATPLPQEVPAEELKEKLTDLGVIKEEDK